MSTNVSIIAEVVDDLLHSIQASPKRQRRLLSKTFWSKFGFKSRTKDRVSVVRETLRQNHVAINLADDVFGTESYGDWIVLTLLEPFPPSMGEQTLGAGKVSAPAPDWFDRIEHRTFESEREVEFYFVLPLMEQLGFAEMDFAAGYPVCIYEGTTKRKKQADCVLFNGAVRDPKNALLVVEAKRPDQVLTSDAIGQAKSYAMWLTSPFYLVTNGDEILVYQFRGPGRPDFKAIGMSRMDLRERWTDLYKLLNRSALVEHKAKLLATFETETMACS